MGKSKSTRDDEWRREIADRINGLIKVSGSDNVQIAVKIGGVGKETVRQWREGLIWPRMDKLKALAAALGSSADYILFGTYPNKSVESLRERICRNDAELALLRLFRSTNRDGKTLTTEAARSYSITHPAPHNVVQLKERRLK